jgi:plasmid stabilization system protein ParE
MDRASQWWRRNRHKAPTAFDDDFDAALDLLRTNPQVGQRVRAGRRVLRRYWLDRVGYFIYYSQPLDDLIVISSIRHGSRGSRSKL